MDDCTYFRRDLSRLTDAQDDINSVWFGHMAKVTFSRGVVLKWIRL